MEAAGGRLPNIYLTMGQYDLVGILEAPDDQTCASIALGLSSLGNVRSTTPQGLPPRTSCPRSWTASPSLEDEFSRILQEFA